MIVKFDNAGEIGVIKDKPAHSLPLNAWSDASNIRFNDGYAEKFYGHSSALGTPSIAPYSVFPFVSSSLQYWIYAGLTSVYLTEGTSHTNITRTSGAYQATAEENWTGGALNGVPILCDGLDTPQMLFPVSASNKLSDLSNWPSNTIAKVVKPYKNFLVALNLVENGDSYPYVLRLSHPADPGSVPSTWDYTDTTKDSIRRALGDSGGDILDGGSLRDSFIIYREFSTWVMRYIGGRFIVETRQLFSSSGIFAKRCFSEFEGKHCVLTTDDLIVHDGATQQSVLDTRYRDTLFTELNAATNNKRTYLSTNYAKNEIWVCYPTGSDNFPTKALVWNYRHNTFGFRTLPGAAHIAFDVIDPQATATWDSDSDVWDSDATTWDVKQYNPSKRAMLMADTTNTKLYKIDDTNQFDGVNFTATLERQDLFADKIDAIKSIKRVYPKFTGSGAVTVYVGGKNAIGDSVAYDSGTSFTIGTDYKVDVRETWRLPAIKFESTGDVSWKLHGYDLDVDFAGER